MSLDEQLCGCAHDLASNQSALPAIKGMWQLNTGKPDTELGAHVGAIASGAAVVANDATVEGIQEHKRSLLGVDMEAYGMAKAVLHSIAPPLQLVIKGAQDFADEAKTDAYREYAAFVSARFLHRFLNDYWGQIRS